MIIVKFMAIASILLGHVIVNMRDFFEFDWQIFRPHLRIVSYIKAIIIIANFVVHVAKLKF